MGFALEGRTERLVRLRKFLAPGTEIVCRTLRWLNL